MILSTNNAKGMENSLIFHVTIQIQILTNWTTWRKPYGVGRKKKIKSSQCSPCNRRTQRRRKVYRCWVSSSPIKRAKHETCKYNVNHHGWAHPQDENQIHFFQCRKDQWIHLTTDVKFSHELYISAPVTSLDRHTSSTKINSGSRWEALQEGTLRGELEKLNLKVRWGRLRSPLKVPSKSSAKTP